MHPELFTLPIFGISIKTYGFCMMVGFLSAVWLAMRRAERVKADPDTVLDLAFVALLFGVGGARVFYVVHYWESQFASAPNRLLAVIDITQGGLEFLGGFLAALFAMLVYAAWKRISIRLYLDILAPSCMWGLAFGRLGCFFNGCCFGGPCTAPSTDQPLYPWAVRFPYASSAHFRQWQDRQVTVPAELIVTSKDRLQPWLVPASLLSVSVEQREQPVREYEQLRRHYEQATAKSPGAEKTAELKAAMEAARKKKEANNDDLIILRKAQRYPSRIVPARRTSVWELEQLASQFGARPVHPTQLYSAFNAILLSGLLTALFYFRKRHGVVAGALLLLYPIPRILLEMIRHDNPHDVVGLTVSQFVSLGMLITGAAYLVLLYKWMPERSPLLSAEKPRSQNV